MTGRGSGRGDRGGAFGGDRRNPSTGRQRDVSRTAGRGAARDAGSPEGDATPAASLSGGAELEELPAQPVIARGTPRLGRSGTLAVAVMIGLLAAGFGLLGGRQSPSPTSEPALGAASTASAAAPQPTLASGESPVVSPWIECAPPPSGVPTVLLEVGGSATPGSVEVISGPNGVAPTPGAIDTDGPTGPGRIHVPPDVITELWIVGGSCAHAWIIDLVNGDVLDSVANPGLNPAYAAQNRFNLVLGPYGGGDYELRAVLLFPTFVARVTWPIHVVPFGRPTGNLGGGRDFPAAAVEGCDVVMTLGSGWEDGPPDCHDDLTQDPGEVLTVVRGQPLEFELVRWEIFTGMATCGRLSGLSFVAEPQPGCQVEGDPADSKVSFQAPSNAGAWTIAIAACAFQFTSQTTNHICGTWYANIDVR